MEAKKVAVHQKIEAGEESQFLVASYDGCGSEMRNHMDMEDEPAMLMFCNTLDGATVVSFI